LIKFATFSSSQMYNKTINSKFSSIPIYLRFVAVVVVADAGRRHSYDHAVPGVYFDSNFVDSVVCYIHHLVDLFDFCCIDCVGRSSAA